MYPWNFDKAQYSSSLFLCILKKKKNTKTPSTKSTYKQENEAFLDKEEWNISRWENVKYSIRWLVYSNNGSHVKRFKWWLITFTRFNMHLILNARTHLFGFLIQNGIIKSTSNTPIYSPYISFNIAIIKVSKDISTVYIIHDCCFVCCYILVYFYFFVVVARSTSTREVKPSCFLTIAATCCAPSVWCATVI